jgi:plastocyanin
MKRLTSFTKVRKMTTESTPKTSMTKKSSRTVWYVAAIVVIAIIVIGVVVYFEWPKGTPTPSTATQLTLYEGEMSSGSYGFGNSNSVSSLTSPGPTITLTKGTTYQMTVYNIGSMPHNWAIVNAQSSTAPVMFGAQIQSAANPLVQGSSGSVTFTPDTAGTYYYICQISGHVALGMWGTVTVNP